MTPRLVLALAAVAYVALVTLASATPGPRAWGVNLPGYLAGPERILVLGVLALGAGLLLWSARRAGAAPGAAVRRGPRGDYRGPALPPWSTILLLPLLVLAFDALRIATHLLGDGQVWIDGLVAGTLPAYSEPLSSTIWTAFAGALRAAGVPVNASTLGYLPMACGIAALLLFAALAAEIAPSPGARPVTALLLLGLGTTQLYFGYVESYPVASIALLAYLWALLRASRGVAPIWLVGILLAVAIAAHAIFVSLVPSYAWLALSGRAAPWRRGLVAIVPVAALGALFALLRFAPSEFLRPFGRVAGAAESAPGFRYGLTGAFTVRRLLDLANLTLLVAPVPLLLLLARASSRPVVGLGDKSLRAPLVLAALPGLAAAAVLVVPGSPAQDWDLMSMTVWPTALLAIALAQPVLAGATRLGRLGLVLLSAGALSAFVLTNANPSTAVRRFVSLLGPDSDLSPHERAYGNEKLVQYYVTRREYEVARPFAQRMVEAEPTNPRYWVKAGAVLTDLGRYGEAAPYFEEALRRSPGRADAIYNLGLSYFHAGRGPEALAAFRAAVAADSERPDYRQNFGVALFDSGEPDSARAVWEEVLRRWPDYPLTRQSLAKHFGPGGDALKR